MKKLILILLPLLIFQCAADKPETTTPVSPVKKESPANIETTTKKTPTDTSLPAATKKKNGPGLNLWINNATAKQGEEVCVKVSVSAISGLLSMQYSLRWDPKVLTFKKLQGFSIATLDENDFGKHLIKEGILTAVWIDDTLKGEQLKDDEQLYELCFTAIGKAGQTTPIRFWTTPTPYESVVLPEKVIPLTPHKGEITIE